MQTEPEKEEHPTDLSLQRFSSARVKKEVEKMPVIEVYFFQSPP
jgi:hypothetical protein